MFSLKDSATAFVPTLENIPPIAITLLNAKVLKIRAIFPKPVMPDHNDGYCAKDVEWLEASIVSAELRSQEREKKEEKRHETLAWSLQEELDKWKHDYNELKDRQDGATRRRSRSPSRRRRRSRSRSRRTRRSRSRSRPRRRMRSRSSSRLYFSRSRPRSLSHSNDRSPSRDRTRSRSKRKRR